MRSDNGNANRGHVSDPDAAGDPVAVPALERGNGAIRKALIILNRNAGGGRRLRRVEEVIGLLRAAGLEVDVHETTCIGDAERTAAAAGDAGADVVICAGGDGTINEVVNGLAGTSTPLALLPIGTANVLAAEIGLEVEPRAIADAILSGAITPIYLGVANGRRFALMAGVGLDAEVVESVDPGLKRAAGKLAYAVATLQRWSAYRDKQFRIEIDGVVYEAASAIVANGHYYAGRFVCADAARITDPGLHVCLFEKPGRWQAIYYMVALFGGFLGRLKSYRIIPATEVSVLDEPDGPVQGDGDVIARLPVSIRVAAETVFLLMPPKQA